MKEFIYFILGLCLWGVLFYLGWVLIYNLLPSNDLLIIISCILWIYYSMYLTFYKIMKFVDEPAIRANVKHLTPEQRKALKKYVVTKAKEAIRGEKVIVSARDRNLKDICLMSAGYMCEIDNNHKTFFDKEGKPYFEAHHIIPLNQQNNYKFELDTLDNLICLCPNCHKAIHYGDYKIKQGIIKRIANIKPIATYDELINIYL